MQFVGKVIKATPDYAVAECRTAEGTVRFTFSDDTFDTTHFRRMTYNDWQRRKGRR